MKIRKVSSTTKYALMFAVVLLAVCWSSVLAENPCASSGYGSYIGNVCFDQSTGNVSVGKSMYQVTPTTYTWQSISGDYTFANFLKAHPQEGYAKICQQLLPYFPSIDATIIATANDMTVSRICGEIANLPVQATGVQENIGQILAYQHTGDETTLLQLVAKMPYNFYPSATLVPPTVYTLYYPIHVLTEPERAPTTPQGVVYLASVSPVTTSTPVPSVSATPTPPPSVTGVPMTTAQAQDWVTYTFCQSIYSCLQSNVDKVAQNACIQQTCNQYAGTMGVTNPAPNCGVSGLGDIATWNDRPAPYCPVDLSIERKIVEITAKILAVKGADYFMSSEEVAWVREIAQKGCEPIETRLALSGGMMYRLWRTFRLIPGVCAGV